jgi:glycosyltransferase involved in cell wall biosynthesis
MILVDALYINNGGGKILLDYLITNLNKSNLDVYFLLDDRIIGKFPEIKSNNVLYLKGSFIKRHYFYSKNKHRFSKVLCFGNLPPNIRLNAKVYTYFHQPMYLDIPNEFSFVEKFKFKLKIAILKQVARNTDYWLVQSNLIKEKLHLKFEFKTESIRILPFYPQFEPLKSAIIREKNIYLYVSNATPHKNHKRLIDVFCQFYDKYKEGKLVITVNNNYPEILELIKSKINKKYPIENIGFVDRLTLQKKYLSSEFLIFPSLTESFGLGLIEAVECGCKVIGADLAYTYEVCEPSLVFDPSNDSSIFKAFENSLCGSNVKSSIIKIKNNIDEMINLLQN